MTITPQDIEAMIRHWLSVPPNGCLGSGYGSDPQSLLQKALLSGIGDEFVQKMIQDIPVLARLPSGTVNVYMEELGNDSKRLLVEVFGTLIPLDFTS